MTKCAADPHDGTGTRVESRLRNSPARCKRTPAMRRRMLFLVGACVLQAHFTAGQGLTGALVGTVKDGQGGVLEGATVRLSSPALIGGPETLTSNEKGQLRFPALT